MFFYPGTCALNLNLFLEQFFLSTLLNCIGVNPTVFLAQFSSSIPSAYCIWYRYLVPYFLPIIQCLLLESVSSIFFPSWKTLTRCKTQVLNSRQLYLRTPTTTVRAHDLCRWVYRGLHGCHFFFKSSADANSSLFWKFAVWSSCGHDGDEPFGVMFQLEYDYFFFDCCMLTFLLFHSFHPTLRAHNLAAVRVWFHDFAGRIVEYFHPRDRSYPSSSWGQRLAMIDASWSWE